MSDVTSALQVLAEPSRLAILDLLRSGERPVGDVVTHIGLTQPTVSKHLRILKDAGLVDSRSDAQRRLYSLRTEPLENLDRWLGTYRALWNSHLDKLEHHLASKRRPR